VKSDKKLPERTMLNTKTILTETNEEDQGTSGCRNARFHISAKPHTHSGTHRLTSGLLVAQDMSCSSIMKLHLLLSYKENKRNSAYILISK